MALLSYAKMAQAGGVDPCEARSGCVLAWQRCYMITFHARENTHSYGPLRLRQAATWKTSNALCQIPSIDHEARRDTPCSLFGVTRHPYFMDLRHSYPNTSRSWRAMHLPSRSTKAAEGRFLNILCTVLHLVDLTLLEGCLHVHA